MLLVRDGLCLLRKPSHDASVAKLVKNKQGVSGTVEPEHDEAHMTCCALDVCVGELSRHVPFSCQPFFVLVFFVFQACFEEANRERMCGHLLQSLTVTCILKLTVTGAQIITLHPHGTWLSTITCPGLKADQNTGMEVIKRSPSTAVT